MPPAPVRVPSQRPLAPSVASVTSVANDKDDNEMILGTVHRSPGICLTAEKNPRKPQLGDRLMKGLCDLFPLFYYTDTVVIRLRDVRGIIHKLKAALRRI